MKIVSIEPTPSPNSMKLNLDTSLPKGKMYSFTREEWNSAPGYIRRLLDIPDVKSVFQVTDFIALDRTPKGDWKQILAAAREVFGETGVSVEDAAAQDSGYGEVTVKLQVFRRIPIQVRVNNDAEEKRASMPQRFSDATMKATASSPLLLKERKLEDLGVRYGELDEVLNEVIQEVDASFDDDLLAKLVEQASSATYEASQSQEVIKAAKLSNEEIAGQLKDADWKKRYAALQSVEPSLETLPLLIEALNDENTSIRRLATVFLGDIKEPEVLPHLYRALEDRTAAVRRTAGDTLSDIGNPAAIPAMIKALKDKNKLVRWRAARFLYEVGDESAVPALKEAAGDPEFEVSLQVQIALERIEGGHEAEGTVWQQMTRRND